MCTKLPIALFFENLKLNTWLKTGFEFSVLNTFKGKKKQPTIYKCDMACSLFSGWVWQQQQKWSWLMKFMKMVWLKAACVINGLWSSRKVNLTLRINHIRTLHLSPHLLLLIQNYKIFRMGNSTHRPVRFEGFKIGQLYPLQRCNTCYPQKKRRYLGYDTK